MYIAKRKLSKWRYTIGKELHIAFKIRESKREGITDIVAQNQTTVYLFMMLYDIKKEN